MDTTLVAVGAAHLVYILTCGVVGVRLLLLARRTRQLPELCLGAGLVMQVLAMPALAIAGMGRHDVDALHLGGTAAAFCLLWMGTTGQLAFTWQAFRPGEAWAGVLAAALSAILAGIVVGVLHSLASAPAGTPSSAASWSWVLALRAPILASMLWTCCESLHQYAMARRRDKLGLGDPIVTNRFLLWSLCTAIAASSTIISAIQHTLGMGPTSSPAAAATLAGFSAVAAVLLWLVFLPPARYLGFVERRAGAAAR